jgi:MFS family permease
MQPAVDRNYSLALLTIVQAFQYIELVALGIVMQGIKVDLSLSDTELGLLSGISFALFYSVMGIPIARWADRGNRVTVIAVTTALWSVAVVLCGMARSLLQLMLMRVGVAVGEAGLQPPSTSLISDYFTRAELPRAVARYHLSWPLAYLLGYFSTGWLNQWLGWRMTFVLIGLPGLALAVLAGLTLKDPRHLRRTTAHIAASPKTPLPSSANQPSVKEVFVRLWGNAAFRHLFLALSVYSFFSYALLQWQAAFFMRTYGLRSGELGTWLAVILGVGSALGVVLGGEWASRFAANNENLQLRIVALSNVAYAILNTCVLLVSEYHLAFGLYALAVIVGAVGSGPQFAIAQTVVPAQMRAMSVALINFFSNLIGMGLGSLAVGALSDALRPRLGEDSLRYALVAVCPGYFWVAWHFWKASRHAHDAAECVSQDQHLEDAREPPQLEQPIHAGSVE